MTRPNSRYMISMSGGLASAASAIIAHEAGLRYEMVFADTLIEAPDLYRFLDDMGEALGKKVIHLADGRDPWDVFVARRHIGNSRTAHCSETLKTKQVAAWMLEHAFYDDPLVLGMYKDEEDRLIRAQRNWNPQEVTSLLIEHSIYPGAANELVAKYGVRRPSLYALGFPHNNCGGMCVRAGQGQFLLLLLTRPDFYLEQEARNEWAIAQIAAWTQERIERGVYRGKSGVGGAGGFIRVYRDGETIYMSMREFRLAVEGGEIDVDKFDMGGCGCFVDDRAH